MFDSGSVRTMDKQVRMVNPLRLLPVIVNLIPFPLFIWLGIYAWSDTLLLMAISIMLFICSGLLLFVSLYPGVVYYPTHIILREDGLTFEFRWSKPKEVPWELIKFVDTHETEDTAGIGLRGELKSYYINVEIANAVRDKYASIMGRHPITGDEYDIKKKALKRL